MNGLINGIGCVVVPWHSAEQKEKFLAAWHEGEPEQEYLILQHDSKKQGCGVTKNTGVDLAMFRGAKVVVVLDDDCFPDESGPSRLPELIASHIKCLEPQQVERFAIVTDPPSRGTPYVNRSIVMPVAASMGFWTNIGDYCAIRQLAFESAPMQTHKKAIFGDYFPLCGMNIAFRPSEWLPWCKFIDVPRYDDIWMGWLWQREAYRRKYCFNLKGPIVKHSRQSNVWVNLAAEARYAEHNDELWARIAEHPSDDYASLRALLRV